MTTDDLISTLSSDLDRRGAWRRWSAGTRLSLAGILTAPFVALIVVDCLPPSEHLRHGLQPTAIFTIAAALLLAGAAYRLAARLSRPEETGSVAAGLWVAPAVLGLGIVAELVRCPPSTWMPSMMGANPLGCFGLVMALSLPILGAALMALRAGAPSRPGRTGALAGAFAGGICSAIYVLHCPENSLLYVAVWHAGAVLVVVGIGAWLGRRVLRW